MTSDNPYEGQVRVYFKDDVFAVYKDGIKFWAGGRKGLEDSLIKATGTSSKKTNAFVLGNALEADNAAETVEEVEAYLAKQLSNQEQIAMLGDAVKQLQMRIHDLRTETP